MPASIFHAGRFRLLTIAGILCLFGGSYACAAPQRNAAAGPSFKKAQKMREALEGRPERQRTRREYDHVIDAYRAVYRSKPGGSHADASVSAVADLLAEEGRVFQDDKALHDAIRQYEFLRESYPQSRYRYSALLTIGEVYLRDLNDPENARATFVQFLKLYPQSPLAAEARIELSNLRHAPRSVHANAAVAQNEVPAPIPAAAKTSTHPSGHHNVPDEAALSPQGEPQTAKAARAVRKSSNPQTNEIAENDLPSASTTESLHPESSHLSEAELNAPPPPRRGRLPLVTGIRHWSTPVYTRVAIDLQDEVQYEAVRVPNPDRIFFDLHGTRLSPELIGKSDQVIDDGFLKQIRAAQSSNDVTRIVLDVSDVSDYSAFFLPNPPRLIIDVHGSKSRNTPVYTAANSEQKTKRGALTGASTTNIAAASAIGLGPDLVSANRLGDPVRPSPKKETTRTAGTPKPAALEDVASLSDQPNRVRATPRPTMAPVAQSVAGTSPAPQPDELAAATPAAVKRHSAQSRNSKQDSQMAEIHAAQLPADGQTSLVRTLGLKINRIVIDAGHGGHDSGTLGPGGIEEKDVVLDVALRLGALLKQKLGADVIYTRDDDTFIPLETRTAIANKAQADLFISIHANSGSDPSARGVETYYLNFTTSADALEVAARENAVSDESIHQLSDLVKKIALQDKINESREFASDVEQSLYSGLEDGNPGLKDRGVKKAPFVVLIGANMPSILAEISFLTNPDDANELRQPQYRERIAEALYRGIARYVGSLSGVRLADASPHSAR
ncbi:MAG: N-acetylmuramoyl-L-alanine amidase [Silvibacterium sp.]